jgi:S1-C subfamily serine protease
MNLSAKIPRPRILDVGYSSSAREDQLVLVIGDPEGLESTVTDGIISAFRDNGAIIQITAPISPGSSGSGGVVQVWQMKALRVTDLHQRKRAH